MDHSRLSMPLGEAIFTQRSIRRFKPDPIPMEDIHLIVEAAVRAPNGGNQQVARLLVVNARDDDLGVRRSSITRHGGRSAATPGTTRSRSSRRTTAPPPGWPTRSRTRRALSSRSRLATARPTRSSRRSRT